MLVLLFHGVGSSAADLAPLAAIIGTALPGATVRCVQAPNASDFGHGWQWFSVQGITEENRPGRVAEALSRFLEAIVAEQAKAGIGPEDTLLVGFSQGAIMALESSVVDSPPAHGVVAIAGRFARLPQRGSAARVHFVHGAADTVVPAGGSKAAHERLSILGTITTLDLVAGAPHGITAKMANAVVRRLTS